MGAAGADLSGTEMGGFLSLATFFLEAGVPGKMNAAFGGMVAVGGKEGGRRFDSEISTSLGFLIWQFLGLYLEIGTSLSKQVAAQPNLWGQ